MAKCEPLEDAFEGPAPVYVHMGGIAVADLDTALATQNLQGCVGMYLVKGSRHSLSHVMADSSYTDKYQIRRRIREFDSPDTRIELVPGQQVIEGNPQAIVPSFQNAILRILGAIRNVNPKLLDKVQYKYDSTVKPYKDGGTQRVIGYLGKLWRYPAGIESYKTKDSYSERI